MNKMMAKIKMNSKRNHLDTSENNQHSLIKSLKEDTTKSLTKKRED